MYDYNNYAHTKKVPLPSNCCLHMLGGNKQWIWLHVSVREKYQNKLVVPVLKRNKTENVVLT